MNITLVRDHELLVLIRSAVSGDITPSGFEERMIAEWWSADFPLARAVWSILSETSGNDSNDIALAELRRLLPSQNDTIVL